jgi:hypothetical protein
LDAKIAPQGVTIASEFAVLSIPVMTGEEFKAAMEKAKNVKSSYTPPTATKQ